MMRGKRMILALLLVGAFSSSLYATSYFGWADEFIGYEVHCYLSNSVQGGCTIIAEWNGPSSTHPYYPPTWSFVGQQGANGTGRANAREKVMFRFSDAATNDCATATATLARFRVTSPPAEGTACGSSGTTIGSRQTVNNSCGLQLADTFVNNRINPVFDFADETGTGIIGYRTSFTVNASNNMGGGTLTFGGCYKIWWF